MQNMTYPLPYGRQWIDDDDITAVIAALKGDWLTQGPLVESFEQKIAEYVGSEYAVAFNSGTSALHGAYYAAGVRTGDEVITSPITFVATANAGVYLGARPVFVDIDKKTWCIDTDKINEAISNRTKVIAPVDFAGYPVDMTSIREIAQDHSCIVVEDAAHALGAIRGDVKVGTEADMTMFSFHPVKHITTGEGGIVTTNNREFAAAMKRFRSHGITKDPELLHKNEGQWYYEMQDLGYNYRITDIQCALGLSQLEKLERFVKRRNEIARMYDEAFRGNEKLVNPPKPPQNSRHAYHLYPVCFTGVDRKKIFMDLREIGIFCQVHYIPVHLQPYYRERFGYHDGDFPVAENFYQSEISLPMFPAMSDEDVERVIVGVQEMFEKRVYADLKLV
ncbi:DegT/DnrJ/EryC1/StrS aminotransferase [Methanospirillum hungatei JF-1]|uniref:DegT/DnrJ/EryC1/StrS aminotransferase n=2 Tax=Methanospirillum hungatei TaxID=2203 RepID=Q2FTQ4_METHJ|nr:DegT/DnrJ/EryC1/StrS aminotransferase [Methanospirillum hungatei JF-1]